MLFRSVGDLGDLAPAEKEMKKIEAMIQSMTKEERANPKVINANRKKRIAKGSATDVSDVNKLLTQFEQMKKMMKKMTNPKGKKRLPKGLGSLKMPF